MALMDEFSTSLQSVLVLLYVSKGVWYDSVVLCAYCREFTSKRAVYLV